MSLLDSVIKKTSPKLVVVDSKYLAYLHNFDSRVSLKKTRPYVGLSIRINGRLYVIPLTSQTTQERKNEHRYIRKHWTEITNKSIMIYLEHKNEQSRNYKFLQSICCDFEMLEDKCDKWI